MDFLKLLKSLEEFVYEVITWLLFFPRTLWRVIVHPMRMAQYAECELRDKLENQFDDALSPPLFLMLAVLLAHAVELATHMQATATGVLSREILGNEQGLLLYRTVTFAIWPLVAAVHFLRRTGVRISRESLRRPFFAQCYLTAPFAITLSTCFVFIRLPGRTSTIIGLIGAALACLWYVCVQAHWLKHALGRAWWPTLLSTLWVLLSGLVINSCVGMVLVAF